jgi:signal transduction histidine kinase
LTNAVRHSQGSLIAIALKLRDGSLEAEVTDNGIGLNAETVPGSGGAGMRNIRQRLANLGGTSNWEPGPQGRGLAVRLSLPIRPT